MIDMEKHTNNAITEERNNMGMVRYYVVDRESTPNSHCGGSFLNKKEGIEQLQRAKRLYPNHSWTLEAMYIVGNKEIASKDLGDVLKESYEDLEDMPEYRPQGDKYYKYGVKGHTYKPDRYNYKTKKWDWGGVEYPYEEFDNIEDALKCYERFRKMENSVPRNVCIMGYYKTLGDDDWEYINPNNIKESKNTNMNKIRLSETQLRKVIKESVKKVLNEESYRKAAKKGEHTSSALKHELNYQKKKGTYKPKDYHKFSNKHGLNKRDVNTICDFEDGINGNGEIVRESSMNDGSSFKMMVWDAINQALEKTFGDFSLGVGNGWDVINPDNEDEYVHITFGS